MAKPKLEVTKFGTADCESIPGVIRFKGWGFNMPVGDDPTPKQVDEMSVLIAKSILERVLANTKNMDAQVVLVPKGCVMHIDSETPPISMKAERAAELEAYLWINRAASPNLKKEDENGKE